jgi:hypothetical protein
MASAAFTALVSQASISMINNRGNIGKVLQELGTIETAKNLAIAMAAAGAFYQVGAWTEGHFNDGTVLGENGRALSPVERANQYLGTVNHAANIAGHAVVGGAVSLSRGGDFAGGALSAGFGAAVSPATFPLNQQMPYSGLATTVAVGGATSALAGGDAGQGAWTAAMGYLYNEMGLLIGASIIGGEGKSFAAGNINGGLVFSDWDPRSWGVMGQITLSDTAGAGTYVGAGVNLGGWISGTNTPSGDSGWSQYKEFNANIGLLGSVGGSFGTTPDAKNGHGSLSGAFGTKVGVGLGAQGSSGTAQSRTWVWRPFSR